MSEERSKELLAHYAQNRIDFGWLPFRISILTVGEPLNPDG